MSQNIESSSATLKSVGGNLTAYGNGAPSYDGQFGPKVREIANGASSQANQLSGLLSGLANWLSNKAMQFLNVDNASSVALGSQFNNLSWMSGLGGIFPPFLTASLLPFLGRYFPNGINIRNWLTGNHAGQPIPLPVPEHLSDIERINGESCAQYAQRRRPNLGHTGGDGGAYNYKYNPGVVQTTNGDNDLTKKIAVGYAVIWDKGDPALKGTGGYTWGHIAIVEAVEGNKIKVSQANWPGHEEMWITIDQLRSSYIYLLP